MKNLADRLGSLADEATQNVELLPPHLAMRVRGVRRHRSRLGISAIAVVVAVTAIVANWPTGSRRVRLTTVPSIASTATTTTAPKAPPLAELASLAMTQARLSGDSSPHDGEVVATNLGAAEHLSGHVVTATDPSAPVYLVVLTGHFTCTTACFGVSAPVMGTTLTLIVGQNIELLSLGLSQRVLDLAPLGRVYRLPPPVGAAVVVPDVVGNAEPDAVAVLVRLGLAATTDRQRSTTVRSGLVIAQHPPAGTTIGVGQSDTIVVSTGPG